MTEKEAIELIKNTALMRYSVITGNRGDLVVALEMAVQALERMLPKKRGKYGCPNCDTLVDMQNYCHECGQRLDWSEEHE